MSKARICAARDEAKRERPDAAEEIGDAARLSPGFAERLADQLCENRLALRRRLQEGARRRQDLAISDRDERRAALHDHLVMIREPRQILARREGDRFVALGEAARCRAL